VDCHCRSSFVWKFTKVSMYLPYNTTITSPHHARNTTMLIIHNRKMKETSPHYKLGEHFHECRAQWRVCLSVYLSIFAALTARREGGRTEPKGLFLYSSYLLVCLTVGKKTQQLCQHRQGFNTARTLRANSRPLWRLSMKIQGRV